MGGNAFSSSDRMGLGAYNDLKRTVGGFLESNPVGCEYRFPAELGDKTSFGDLDVVVMMKQPTKVPEFISSIEREFGEIVASGSVFSFLVNNHQVDFILVNAAIDFAERYFSNSDIGNLLGYYAMHKGYKLGHTGLYVSRNIPNVGKERHYVTKNWREALDIMGFEGMSCPLQFPNARAMLNFVASSNLFKHRETIFSLDKLNSRHRATIRKRQYQRLFFCEYLGYPEKAFSQKR